MTTIHTASTARGIMNGYHVDDDVEWNITWMATTYNDADNDRGACMIKTSRTTAWWHRRRRRICTDHTTPYRHWAPRLTFMATDHTLLSVTQTTETIFVIHDWTLSFLHLSAQSHTSKTASTETTSKYWTTSTTTIPNNVGDDEDIAFTASQRLIYNNVYDDA